MIALLREASSRNIYPDYVKKLLNEVKKEKSKLLTSDLELASEQLVDSLSQRELEVLRLIAGGLKYKEIAGKLFVSLNTVRTHTKSIYSKLSVNSRQEAVNKAQELNIL